MCFSVVSEHIRRQNVAENEMNSNEKIAQRAEKGENVISESSDLALLPHPATVPTVIIVTNKAANTRFFIILNLLFFI